MAAAAGLKCRLLTHRSKATLGDQAFSPVVLSSEPLAELAFGPLASHAVFQCLTAELPSAMRLRRSPLTTLFMSAVLVSVFVRPCGLPKGGGFLRDTWVEPTVSPIADLQATKESYAGQPSTTLAQLDL